MASDRRTHTITHTSWQMIFVLLDSFQGKKRVSTRSLLKKLQRCTVSKKKRCALAANILGKIGMCIYIIQKYHLGSAKDSTIPGHWKYYNKEKEMPRIVQSKYFVYQVSKCQIPERVTVPPSNCLTETEFRVANYCFISEFRVSDPCQFTGVPKCTMRLC
jgi:hypothetical protein